MDEEVLSVDVTVQTPEPSLETPLQEEPKTLDFLVGQLTEKITSLETSHHMMQQTIEDQTNQIQSLRELERMNSEDVYRIATEVMNQVQELREEVEEVTEEQEVTESIEEIPVLPSQDEEPSMDTQEQPKPAKKRPWFL